jgi:hypothetical protein
MRRTLATVAICLGVAALGICAWAGSQSDSAICLILFGGAALALGVWALVARNHYPATSDRQDDGTSAESNKRSWAWIWCALFAAFVLYPLSMGPVLKYSNLNSHAVWSAYAPLIQVCDMCSPLENLKDWYNGLWGEAYERDRSDPKSRRHWRRRWP